MSAPAAVAETHCATVFFSGDRAYKVKKPVDLGFLDFRTVGDRERACRREVELNRRFAPDVYLGVARVSDEAGRVCDWMVVMRRMPPERRLSALVRAGADVDTPLRALARQLAAHHATARRSPGIDAAGSPEALRARWVATLETLAGFADEIGSHRLDALGAAALDFVDGCADLLREQVAAGRVRDGHGDLLADDVFCLDDGPRALDCLEFDDDLRAVDGLDDAACLAMDLERLGAPEAAERFLGWFLEFSGRTRVEALMHHYVAYRAGVRLKVACLRHEQGDEASLDQIRILTAVALRHLELARPVLVLVGGSPGTGKSTVAGALADRLGAVLLRSDRLRKERAGRDPLVPTVQGWGEGLYQPSLTADTYQALTGRAAALLARGERVVLDASWNSEEARAGARAVATAVHVPVVELRCKVPPEVAARRIGHRSGDPSDATPAIASRLAAGFTPWPEATVIDTQGLPADAADRAETAVRPALRIEGGLRTPYR